MAKIEVWMAYMCECPDCGSDLMISEDVKRYDSIVCCVCQNRHKVSAVVLIPWKSKTHKTICVDKVP